MVKVLNDLNRIESVLEPLIVKPRLILSVFKLKIQFPLTSFNVHMTGLSTKEVRPYLPFSELPLIICLYEKFLRLSARFISVDCNNYSLLSRKICNNQHATIVLP